MRLSRAGKLGARDERGRTALHAAVAALLVLLPEAGDQAALGERCAAAARMLLAAANAGAVDADGHTPRELADLAGCPELHEIK